MAASKKNLLEAFQNAGDVPHPDREAEREPPPLAAPEPAPARSGNRRRPAWRWPFPADRVPPGLLLAAAAGAIFALGVALGRASRPTPPADRSTTEEPLADTGPPRGGIAPAATPRDLATRPVAASSPRVASPTGDAPRIEDSPLSDPTNRYTIVVSTYTTQNPDPAWATYLHLREEGFEVFPPVAKGEHLLILVGAAPRSRDLESTRDAIRRLRRGGEAPYHDAYCAPIDRYIDR